MKLRTEQVRAALLAAVHELDPVHADLEVRPILNWGGFVNRSFEVRAASAHWFLKLAADPATHRALQRWLHMAPRLEALYHAPRVRTEVRVADTPWAGLLFEWLDGEIPSLLETALAARITALLDGLHADGVLARFLADSGARPRTCADAYLDTLDDRFSEDLKGIAARCPPFVSADRLRWMGAEAAALRARVLASRAFMERADAPTHGDVWLNNLIVQGDGRVRVLDWDGLALADPVLDWATLFGPTRQDLRPVTERRAEMGRTLPDAEEERLALLARATSLDWVIDPIADWVEADEEGEHGATVRRANEQLFERAVAAYAEYHGNG